MNLPYNVFPVAVASALRSNPKSYLTPHGVVVRQASGQEEVLVSYPQLGGHPEFENYTEGFRERAHEPGAGYVKQEGDEAQDDQPKDPEPTPAPTPAPEAPKPKAKPGPKPKAAEQK